MEYIKYRDCTIAYPSDTPKSAIRRAKKKVNSLKAKGIQMSRIELDGKSLEVWQEALLNFKK